MFDYVSDFELYAICHYIRRAHMGINLFNCLPLKLKQLYNDVTYFKIALKEVLCCHSFYTLEEYFEYSNRNDMSAQWFVVRFVCKCIICVFLVLLNINVFFVSICYLHIMTISTFALLLLIFIAWLFPHPLTCVLYGFMEIKVDSQW
jgi:hypothetical protein